VYDDQERVESLKVPDVRFVDAEEQKAFGQGLDVCFLNCFPLLSCTIAISQE